jgi:hypothetical protein
MSSSARNSRRSYLSAVETLFGIQQTKNVLSIDFENIAISLNEQGYTVNSIS